MQHGGVPGEDRITGWDICFNWLNDDKQKTHKEKFLALINLLRFNKESLKSLKQSLNKQLLNDIINNYLMI